MNSLKNAFFRKSRRAKIRLKRGFIWLMHAIAEGYKNPYGDIGRYF
jgi:hypothetical protein